tara:strand:- start:203 stop:541 length:339 start_codon:yes stop_codon:yes gene_type:complete
MYGLGWNVNSLEDKIVDEVSVDSVSHSNEPIELKWDGGHYVKYRSTNSLKDEAPNGKKKEDRERRVELLASRWDNGLDLFTGEPITGDDLETWNRINVQREVTANSWVASEL